MRVARLHRGVKAKEAEHLLAGEDAAGEEGDSELLVDHEGEDAHHGGTALVELDGALLELGLLVEGFPAEVDGSVAEVADELAGLGAVGGVLHDEGLEEADEGEELEEAGSRDVLEGLESGGDVGEADALAVGDVAGEADAGGGGEVTGDGEHGDAAVLDLDVTEAVEVGLITVGDEAKGIVEAKRGLGSELVLEGTKGGGGLAGLGGGKGGGRAKDGGEADGGLHGYVRGEYKNS